MVKTRRLTYNLIIFSLLPTSTCSMPSSSVSLSSRECWEIFKHWCKHSLHAWLHALLSFFISFFSLLFTAFSRGKLLGKLHIKNMSTYHNCSHYFHWLSCSARKTLHVISNKFICINWKSKFLWIGYSPTG